MKLYICGNGFDLHHGLKTSYDDYKKFLEKHHRDTLIDFEHYTKIGNTYDFCWSDIEKALEIDMSKLIEKCLIDYVDDPIIQVHPENYNHMEDYDLDEEEVYRTDPLAREMTNLVSFIDNFTALHFMEWLCSIDLKHSKNDPVLGIDPQDLYITFNYLDSLKQIYKIPADRILHVHGSLEELGSVEKVRRSCMKLQRNGPRVVETESEREEDLIKLMKNEIRGTLQFGAARDFDQEFIRIDNLYYNNLDVVGVLSVVDEAIQISSK